MSSTVLGAIAAAAAPLFMSIGFCLWDWTWTAHAFSLNVFKCSQASAVFLVVAGVIFYLEGESTLAQM